MLPAARRLDHLLEAHVEPALVELVGRPPAEADLAHPGELGRLGPEAAQADLKEPIAADRAAIDDEPHGRAVRALDAGEVGRGIGVRVEVDDADRAGTVVVGDRRHVRVGDRVVAAEHDRDGSGRADLRDPPADRVVAARRVTRNRLGVAVVDDLQDREGIDAEQHVRPRGRQAASLVSLADRPGPVAAAGTVRDRLVHRRAEDRNVDPGELAGVEHERELREGRDPREAGLPLPVDDHRRAVTRLRARSRRRPRRRRPRGGRCAAMTSSIPSGPPWNARTTLGETRTTSHCLSSMISSSSLTRPEPLTTM